MAASASIAPIPLSAAEQEGLSPPETVVALSAFAQPSTSPNSKQQLSDIIQRKVGSSVKANVVPGALMTVLGLTLILLYYYVPTVEAKFNILEAYKEKTGYSFSVVSTMIMGGLLPGLVVVYRNSRRSSADLASLVSSQTAQDFRVTGASYEAASFVFLLLFWAWKGAEVDAFYRGQAEMFGNSPAASTVAKKVLFDQFVYNPFWACWYRLLSLLLLLYFYRTTQPYPEQGPS
jgi:hypothetical protein